jgi:exportin-7
MRVIPDSTYCTSYCVSANSYYLTLYTNSILHQHTLLQIGNNLKYWPQEEEVVDKTLALFLDMASSYSSSKLLLGLDTVKFLLQHHGEEHFPFLSVAGNTRHRTTFHLTLARLIFTTTEELQPLFEAFVAPLTATLAQLGAAASFRQESVKRAIIGVCRGEFATVHIVTCRVCMQLFTY